MTSQHPAPPVGSDSAVIASSAKPTAKASDVEAPEPLRPGFATAFSHAVASSGHSLEWVRRELAARGHRVSMATLSYWRTGQRKPGRARSLAAVAEIERLLEAPTGALVHHVIPADGGQQHGLTDFLRIAGIDARHEKALSRFGLSFDDGLKRLSIQDVIELDAQGRQIRARTRMVVRAMRDDVRRLPILFSVDEGAALTVRPLAGFRLGRRLLTPDGQVALSEGLLNQPLHLGEATMLEFESLAGENAPPTRRFLRGHARMAALQVLTVAFHPSRMPTSLERYEQSLAQTRPTVSPVLLPSPVISLMYHDVGPGIAGCRWQW